MELYGKKEDCCGCGACAEACRAGAISMKEDKEGFPYPSLNQALCIGCGRCQAVCPIQSKDKKTGENVYIGAQARDKEERLSSSSGGLFPALAQYVLQRRGAVYGAAYNDAMEVLHKRASAQEQLEELKKTKYVQSGMKGIYRRIQKDLEENRWVLFCGTPCQTEALRLFLAREYPTLITVDLVCYGVPSPGIWRSYVRYLERTHSGRMTEFFFRDKRGADNGRACAYRIGDKEYAVSHSQNPYCRLYFGGYILRPSCYTCRFCTTERNSDFTIGDFWGIDRIRPEMDDGLGTSLAILHTDKASRVWEEVRDSLLWFSCEKKDILQPRLVDPTSPAAGRRQIMALYRLLPFSWFMGLLPLGGFLQRVKAALTRTK